MKKINVRKLVGLIRPILSSILIFFSLNLVAMDLPKLIVDKKVEEVVKSRGQLDFALTPAQLAQVGEAYGPFIQKTTERTA